MVLEISRPNLDFFSVGGSLRLDAPTYIRRKADQDLYEGIKAGEFCYVLNSRQMGKSSLRVQVMHRLQQEGFACADLDMTGIGGRDVLDRQWYGGIIDVLVRRLHLKNKINVREWLKERDYLSPVQRLGKFVEEVLLVEISQPIVIFIDEIDSTLSLNFSRDDFFALIRSWYNQRVDRPEFNRLTVVLLGVATPSDLIQDRNRTPFNIGRAIELCGFEFEEAEPLAQGLVGKAEDPQALLKGIIDWTGGQPFLTQKLCQMVLNEPGIVQRGTEQTWIDQLVEKRVIQNWEAQDNPEHFKTIRNRILKDDRQAGQLLGLCQQILQAGSIAVDNSPEQIELRLTGLVVKQQGELRIFNRVYAEIFNQEWVAASLAKLRPYGEALAAWIASNREDDSRLLQGLRLKEALAWSEDKNLGEQDSKFLLASQEFDRGALNQSLEAAQRATEILSQANLAAIKSLEDEQKAKEILRQANLAAIKSNQQAKRQILFGSVVLFVSIFAAAILGVYNYIQIQGTEIQIAATNANTQWSSHQELDALLEALRASKKVQGLGYLNKFLENSKLNNSPIQVTALLREIVYGIHERNRLTGHKSAVSSVSFSPDWQTLASGSWDKTIKLWNVSDGKEIRTLTGHQDTVTSMSFSPDGKTLASGSNDNTIKLWNVADGKEIRTLSGHQFAVLSVSFSPDGQTLASGSYDNTIKLWNVADGKEIRTLTGHQNYVRTVSFSPDGQTLASGSYDKTIKLWSVADGKEIDTLTGHQFAVLSVSFSPDGKTLASGSYDDTIKLWNVSDGKEIRTLSGHKSAVSSVSFSLDGKTLASGSDDKTIKLWNVSDGKEIRTLAGHQSFVTSVSFSPDGQTLASGSYDQTIKLWNVSDGKEIRTLTGHQDAVSSVSFSPDGKTLASGSRDKTIKLWNVSDGKEIRTLTGHQDAVSSVSFSPDGKTLASGSADNNTIKLWNVVTGKATRTLNGHQSYVTSVSFSPDGQTLASGSFDNTIKLWNVSNGKEIRTLSGHQSIVMSVSFSPDGQTLASGSYDQTIKLWNVSDGKEIRTLAGHQSFVRSVSFSPDGQTLASGSDDKTIKLWNVSDGKEICTLTGHQSWVNSVSFSPDGQTLVSGDFVGSGDHTIKLWKVSDGKEIRTLTGHQSAVSSVSFSPDGKTLASGSSDKTIKLWNLDLDDLIVRGCNWIRPYLLNNPTVSEEDRHLCDGVRPLPPAPTPKLG